MNLISKSNVPKVDLKQNNQNILILRALYIIIYKAGD